MANYSITPSKLKELYKRYTAKYDDTKRWMRKHGMSMYDTRYSYLEFESMYEAAANELTGEGFASNRSREKAAIELLVDRQRSEITHNQAIAYQKAHLEQYGEHISLDQIYKTLPDQLREFNDQMKKDGIESGAERRALIAAAFFGSPT